VKRFLLSLLLVLVACRRTSPGRIDAMLAGEIDKIQAIDNHAHPVAPAGDPPDKDYDALPVEQLEASLDPARMRPGAAAIREAHRELGEDRNNPARVLDHAGIGIMIANRVAMGKGLPADRFQWVAYADAFMYPLDNTALGVNSDRKAFFALEDMLLARYYRESGVAGKTKTLDEYLTKVVRPTLERHKQGGALAEKFEMAYLRTLEVGNPTLSQAQAAWSGKSEYRALQDYLFRYIATECGRLGMAVHIHTGAGGGGYFDVAGSNPALLEPLFNDPSLRKTNFVMLHGGWPHAAEITPLLSKPNVWVDFSFQGLVLPREELARNLRGWLEYVPERVLFGTDAYPYSVELGWQETAVASAQAGREALGIALTQMMRDGEIDEDRAVELARMVLRENARKLYQLK
jgi:hypothetical protein